MSNKDLNVSNFFIKLESKKWNSNNQNYIFNNINIIYKENLDNYKNFINYKLDKIDSTKLWHIDITDYFQNTKNSNEIFYVSGIDYKKIEYGLNHLSFFTLRNIEDYFKKLKKKDNFNKFLITNESFLITNDDIQTEKYEANIFEIWQNHRNFPKGVVVEPPQIVSQELLPKFLIFIL
ncbi:hypothetical protein RRG50_05065 [Mycoplasmopsis felis]|uniref:hypothetical protein n=1 Tax=Mycoplasmopsis felis TaxID=33923 RepID=UPI002B000FCC|nr:hypothetical protein [Mycoplasmopsis felis]WQQ10859.1 hypothetical protein RRG45_03780 [Mycoplasmopsis felis]